MINYITPKKILCEVHKKFDVENEIGTKLETGFINDILKHIKIEKYKDIKFNDIDSIEIKYDYMNEDIDSVWYNGIKFDINNKLSPGIIGVKSFIDSITPILNIYIDDKIKEEFNKKNDKYDKIQFADQIAKDFYNNILKRQWDIVYNKWKDSFLAKPIDDKHGRYKEDYYIQKTIGTKAINSLLIYDKKEINLDRFEEIINKSKLISINWSKGDIFTGVSSFAGAKVISDKILNK